MDKYSREIDIEWQDTGVQPENIQDKSIQINLRLTLEHKQLLLEIAKSKGVRGIAGLLQLIAKARRVDILT